MGKPKSGIERRKHARLAKRLSVLCECEGTYWQGHIKNVSKSGVFVRSTMLPEPGSEVRLKFETLDGLKVDETGRVCWTTAGLPKEEAASGFGALIDSPGREYREFFAELAGVKR